MRLRLSIPLIMLLATHATAQDLASTPLLNPTLSDASQVDAGQSSPGTQVVIKFAVGLKVEGSGPGLRTGDSRLNRELNRYTVVSKARLIGTDTASAVERIRRRFPRRALRSGGAVPDLDNIYIVTIDEDPTAVARALSDLPGVEYAHALGVQDADYVPNDPMFVSGETWNLHAMSLEAAWDYTRGSGSVVIAVVEDGVNIEHPELVNKLWINPGEDLNENGIADDYNDIDDDGNGYADDIRGWNGRDDSIGSRPHGTGVAGLVGAEGDNLQGLLGVCPECAIMVVTNEYQSREAAIYYAVINGADVINNSWRNFVDTQFTRDMVAFARSTGAVIVSSAGNQAAPAYSQFPAGLEQSITVGSVNADFTRSNTSNFGSRVDVVAPGNLVPSLSEFDYGHFSGTSAAAPHVSGAVGLALTLDPGLTHEELRSIIRMSADDVSEPISGEPSPGWDRWTGYGLINADAMLSTVLEPGRCQAKILSPTVNFLESDASLHQPYSKSFFYRDGRVLITGDPTVQTVASGDDFEMYRIEIGQGEEPTAWEVLDSGNTTDPTFYWADPILGDGTHTLRLVVEDSTFGLCEDRVHIQAGYSLIVTPPANNLLFAGNPIAGRAFHPDFTDWDLSIRNRDGTWYELRSGAVPPGETLIESFMPPPELTEGVVELRLRVTANDGTTHVDTVSLEFELSAPAQENFPVDAGGLTYGVGSVVPVDVDGDFEMEVVYGSSGGFNETTSRLIARDADGSMLDGFPVTLDGYAIHAAPAVADLDGDGTKEIGIISHSEGDYSVYLLDANGVVLPGWPKRHQNSYAPFLDEVTGASVAFVDVSDDAVLDVVYTQRGVDEQANDVLFAYDMNGDAVEGFPFRWIGGSRVAPAIGNVIGDEAEEIVVATVAGELLVISKTGDLLRSWTYRNFESQDRSPPILVDMDDDPQFEIVESGAFEELHAWNGDGSNVPGWPITIGPPGVSGAPIAGDMDGDGEAEIVISLLSLTESGDLPERVTRVGAYNTDGTPVTGWPVDASISELGDLFFQGVMVDVTGNGKANLVIGPWRNLHERKLFVFAENGELLNVNFHFDGIGYSSPAAGDIDRDGDVELLFAENFDGQLRVWDLDAAWDSTALHWPQLGQRPDNTHRLERGEPEPECLDGAARSCSLVYGVCASTQQACEGGAWSECRYPETFEVEEASCDRLDNDCDGFVDEGCRPPSHRSKSFVKSRLGGRSRRER